MDLGAARDKIASRGDLQIYQDRRRLVPGGEAVSTANNM